MLHSARGRVSVWSGRAQERNGWGKKRRQPSEEMRTVASFSAVSSPLTHPLLSRIEKAQKVSWIINTHKLGMRERQPLNYFIPAEHGCSSGPQSSFCRIKTPLKNHSPLPFDGDPLRVLMTGTGSCNKSTFAATPLCPPLPRLERNLMCRRRARPALQSPGPSFEAASVFQQLTTFRWWLWRFMSWVIAIPTHVLDWGPRKGQAELRVEREMPNSSGVRVGLGAFDKFCSAEFCI